jgi:hypothetical protein
VLHSIAIDYRKALFLLLFRSVRFSRRLVCLFVCLLFVMSLVVACRRRPALSFFVHDEVESRGSSGRAVRGLGNKTWRTSDFSFISLDWRRPADYCWSAIWALSSVFSLRDASRRFPTIKLLDSHISTCCTAIELHDIAPLFSLLNAAQKIHPLSLPSGLAGNAGQATPNCAPNTTFCSDTKLFDLSGSLILHD